MIETNYDFESGYHEGSIVVQDALASLGVYKHVEDVPTRHSFGRFYNEVAADEAWEEFKQEWGVVDYSENTQKYTYEKSRSEWRDFCADHGVHPALADPSDFEKHFSEQMEDMSTYKSGHDLRFRPLYLWYRWMVWHPEYPQRYNPMLMAVLFEGTVARLWRTRIEDRENNPIWKANAETEVYMTQTNE